jgi:hypothetical protein
VVVGGKRIGKDDRKQTTLAPLITMVNACRISLEDSGASGAHVTNKKLLKGHGNEADFLGFLQKLDPYRSLKLPFEPFRFWLRIRGDIRHR